MILKKIILNNISSYEGYNEFDFSPNGDKNIILIGGKNGAGKTSLFNAIKLGLYGPLNYNYQTVHSQYLAKIKEIINKKAFTEETVEAYVMISFDYINVRECINYELKRSWRYIDQRIVETFEVKQDGAPLNEAQLIYFDNFLQTILPPNLFSLFFFDGEELSNIFVGSKFNQYIKEAFMVLCNFDSFELIKKYSKNYIARNNSSSEAKEIEKQLLSLLDELDAKRAKVSTYKIDLTTKLEELEKAHTTKEELQKNFKEQGGLAEQEKLEIERKIKKHESNKATQSIVLKNFLEDLMPFIIVKDMAPSIKTQIIKEQTHDQQLNALKYLSSAEVTQSILSTLKSIHIDESNIDINKLSTTIHTALVSDINTKLQSADFKPLHNTSLAGQNSLLSISQKVESFNQEIILEAIESKQTSQRVTSMLNDKLRSSMPEDILKLYLKQLEDINIAILNTQQEIFQLEQNIEFLNSEMNNLEAQCDKMRETLKNLTQDKSVYELTQTIHTMLEDFLQRSSTHKLRELEENFKENFKALFRKENFIDEIKIDDQFNIHIYRKKIFTYDQIEKLINNLGDTEFSKYVGPMSLEILYNIFDSYDISTVSELKRTLQEQIFIGTSVEIYERINIQQLSKGEKQIYMLSLYWALIKISSHEVPFIIDTPYARIDTEHRDNVTSKFLPHVAHQVIILSTDEEIDQHYYNILQPRIAKEYLLVYNSKEKNTQIFNKYFYKVTI